MIREDGFYIGAYNTTENTDRMFASLYMNPKRKGKITLLRHGNFSMNYVRKIHGSLNQIRKEGYWEIEKVPI